MKFVDEFRDPQHAATLLAAIRRGVSRRWTIMEVCGGQTHSLLRYGIEDELQDLLELVHGPGCPVCVTPILAIEAAIALALRPQTILTSFGDMLRVPGSHKSLLQVRAAGGDVRLVYSPLDAVALAQREPGRQVVFFAVGFETTAPATALAVLQAARLELKNFSVLCSHVRVQPAMEQILRASDCRVEGFLAAGHVCTVIGYESYKDLVGRFGVPVVVTGFEPVDLLVGIHECVRQLESGQPAVANQYGRSARAAGNLAARRMIDQVFAPSDRAWRGMGVIPGGGLDLRPLWEQFDARQKFDVRGMTDCDASDCPSGAVMAGRLRPPECPHFGKSCTPEHPLGAPMVSAEGACAAYFRYRAAALDPVEVSTT